MDHQGDMIEISSETSDDELIFPDPDYSVGDRIEVCETMDGLVRTYSPGMIRVGAVGPNRFVVRYEHFVARIGGPAVPHVETFDRSELRPAPPSACRLDRYRVHDEVDVFTRDTWWAGRITEVERGRTRRYRVYFPDYGSRMWVPSPDLLRIHVDWVRNQWRIQDRHARLLEEE